MAGFKDPKVRFLKLRLRYCSGPVMDHYSKRSGGLNRRAEAIAKVNHKLGNDMPAVYNNSRSVLKQTEGGTVIYSEARRLRTIKGGSKPYLS